MSRNRHNPKVMQSLRKLPTTKKVRTTLRILKFNRKSHKAKKFASNSYNRGWRYSYKMNKRATTKVIMQLIIDNQATGCSALEPPLSSRMICIRCSSPPALHQNTSLRHNIELRPERKTYRRYTRSKEVRSNKRRILM